MALGAVRILGYAIISRDGMIADAGFVDNRTRPDFFPNVVDTGGLDVPGRHRDRDSKVDAITAISATPQILRWNPLGSRDGAWGEGQRLRRSDGSIR
jgi:hypothetical protein